MKSIETTTWESVRLRAVHLQADEIVQQTISNWMVDESYTENPLLQILRKNSVLPEAFEERRIVDVRELQPGDDLLFQIRASPTYYVQVHHDDTVTMWINSAPIGLRAHKDALATNLIRSKREKGTWEHYPATLIQDRYRQLRTRVVLPYFSFSSTCETLPPDNAWIDSIASIRVRRLAR